MGLPENPHPGGVRCLARHQWQQWEKQELKGTSKRHGRARQGPATSDPPLLPLILPCLLLPCPTVALLVPGDPGVAMPMGEGRAARCMTPWMGEGS